MDGKADSAAAGAIEDLVRLETRVILARASLSPLAIAERRRAGRMELDAEEGGRAYLEVGGVVVAEGRIVRRRGSSYFRVERRYAEGGREES